MKEKIKIFSLRNYLKIIIIFGILFYPVTFTGAMCLVFLSPLPQQQLQIQGVATINNDVLPIGTKINYSIQNPIVCGGIGGSGVLIIDQIDGHYGPMTISFSSLSDVYINLQISEIPQDYLGGRVIENSQSLSFTITPSMIGTMVNQDIAFQVSLIIPTPTPVPTLISTPIPTPPKYPFLGNQILITPTPTPILTPTPRPNDTMLSTVVVSSSPYQNNLTLISWVIHNDPRPDLNGMKIDVSIDDENAWSGSYGMSTPNPYSISYAYALTPTLHTVKTILIDQTGNSYVDIFSFIPTLISASESTLTPAPTLTPTPTPIPTPTPSNVYIPLKGQLINVNSTPILITPVLSPSPSPTPEFSSSPTPTLTPKSNNIIIKFFNWIKGIFKK